MAIEDEFAQQRAALARQQPPSPDSERNIERFYELVSVASELGELTVWASAQLEARGIPFDYTEQSAWHVADVENWYSVYVDQGMSRAAQSDSVHHLVLSRDGRALVASEDRQVQRSLVPRRYTRRFSGSTELATITEQDRRSLFGGEHSEVGLHSEMGRMIGFRRRYSGLLVQKCVALGITP